MYAIVEITGVQTRVSPDERLRVPLLKSKPGEKVLFTNILLAGNDADSKVGSPYIKGSVEATVLSHGKDSTVYIFKKKRRKGYRKLNGHRQKFSTVQITGMNIEGLEVFKSTAEIIITQPANIDNAPEMQKDFDDTMNFDEPEVEVEEVIEKPAPKRGRKKTS